MLEFHSAIYNVTPKGLLNLDGPFDGPDDLARQGWEVVNVFPFEYIQAISETSSQPCTLCSRVMYVFKRQRQA